jgi:hypothetical protein
MKEKEGVCARREKRGKKTRRGNRGRSLTMIASKGASTIT